MSIKELEQRLTALESEVARLKADIQRPKEPWWVRITGTFQNDPFYEEAMELGRKYRESLRPLQSSKRKSKNGHS